MRVSLGTRKRNQHQPVLERKFTVRTYQETDGDDRLEFDPAQKGNPSIPAAITFDFVSFNHKPSNHLISRVFFFRLPPYCGAAAS